MKTIDTLLYDVYRLLEKKDGWFTNDLAASFAQDTAKRVQRSLGPDGPASLRLSKLGPVCPKALWSSIHTPDLAEPLPAPAIFKYSYGHVIESLAITLAKAAGHEVTGEQDALEVDGIVGHRDCVIDGHVVDVKSCSSRVFQKINSKALAVDDGFGYLCQLDAYLVGCVDDPLVRHKDVGYIWAIDKTLGKMVLYKHEKREDFIRERIRSHKRISSLPVSPECECGTRPYGVSGNMELDVRASYSAYKFTCFPHLRTFLYSDGPKFLTKVVRTPDVTEVDRNGNYIYH